MCHLTLCRLQGDVTWQSVYNRIYDSGLLKELNADDNEVGEDNDEAGQEQPETAV